MIRKVDNKGFIFIETIITVVILITTLVLLYSTYNRVVIVEKRRLYYDDIAYIYKTIVIGDILKKTSDPVKFETALNKATTCASQDDINCRYIYIFNIGSDIYNDNTLITNAHTLLDFSRLVYVKIADIAQIKTCLQGKDNSNICKNTKSFIDGYAYAYLSDYILTLDVPTDTGYTGILISLIYENKNGGKMIDEGKYEECIQEKIYKHYGLNISISNPNDQNAIDLLKQQQQNAINNYYNNDTFSFNMQCENGYYLSWVYL